MSIPNNYVPLKQLGNGVTTQFSDTWQILSASYIQVFLEDVTTGVQTPVDQGGAADEYTVTFDDSGFEVTFGTAPTSANYVVIGRLVAIDQSTPYKTSKGFQGEVTEDSFDKLTAIDQDQQDEIGRTLKFPLGSSLSGVLPAVLIEGYGLVCDGVSGKFRLTASNLDTIVSDATAQAVAAAASALAAGTSETNAGTSEINAAASEANAAASEAAAAAAVASAPFRDVVFITNANSPYTVTSADNGKFLSVDAAGGAVIVNLPTISTLTLPFNVTIKKTDSGVNTVTVNRGGTDTFVGGATSKVQSTVGGFTCIADDDGSPDTWSTSAFGASAGDMKLDTFTDGGGFTAGSSTTVTLTEDPGSENNTWVFFDGVYQEKNEYSVSGTTVTFTAAIPAGVSRIDVQYGTTLSVGVPSDTSITFPKLASSAIASQAEAEAGASTDKLMTPQRAKQNVEANPFVPKVLVNYSMNTGVLTTHASLGAATVVRDGTGLVTITFDNDFANTDYHVFISGATGATATIISRVNSALVGSVQITHQQTVSGYNNQDPINNQKISVAIFGELA